VVKRFKVSLGLVKKLLAHWRPRPEVSVLR